MPPEVRASIGQCHELLNEYSERASQRVAFLESAAQHIDDVIIPAMKDFALQFPKQDFVLDVKAHHPLTPSAELSYESPKIPGLSRISMGIRYSPSNDADLVQITIIRDGPIPLNAQPLNELTREAVLGTIAAIFLTSLKKDLKPLRSEPSAID